MATSTADVKSSVDVPAPSTTFTSTIPTSPVPAPAPPPAGLDGNAVSVLSEEDWYVHAYGAPEDRKSKLFALKPKLEMLIKEALMGHADVVIEELKKTKLPIFALLKINEQAINLLIAAVLGGRPELVEFLVKECSTFDKDCGIDIDTDIHSDNEGRISPESPLFYVMALSNREYIESIYARIDKEGKIRRDVKENSEVAITMTRLLANLCKPNNGPNSRRMLIPAESILILSEEALFRAVLFLRPTPEIVAELLPLFKEGFVYEGLPLFLANILRSPELALKMLQAGAKINSALYLRFIWGSDLAKVLVKLKTEFPEWVPGLTPLMMATLLNDERMVELFIKEHADVNAAHTLAGSPNNYFYARQISIRAHNYEGYTALMLAVQNNRPGIVRLLLKAGASPDHLSANGSTAKTLVGKLGSGDIGSLLHHAQMVPYMQPYLSLVREAQPYKIHHHATIVVFKASTPNAKQFFPVNTPDMSGFGEVVPMRHYSEAEIIRRLKILNSKFDASMVSFHNLGVVSVGVEETSTHFAHQIIVTEINVDVSKELSEHQEIVYSVSNNSENSNTEDGDRKEKQDSLVEGTPFSVKALTLIAGMKQIRPFNDDELASLSQVYGQSLRVPAQLLMCVRNDDLKRADEIIRKASKYDLGFRIPLPQEDVVFVSKEYSYVDRSRDHNTDDDHSHYAIEAAPLRMALNRDRFKMSGFLMQAGVHYKDLTPYEVFRCMIEFVDLIGMNKVMELIKDRHRSRPLEYYSDFKNFVYPMIDFAMKEDRAEVFAALVKEFFPPGSLINRDYPYAFFAKAFSFSATKIASYVWSHMDPYERGKTSTDRAGLDWITEVSEKGKLTLLKNMLSGLNRERIYEALEMALYKAAGLDQVDVVQHLIIEDYFPKSIVDDLIRYETVLFRIGVLKFLFPLASVEVQAQLWDKTLNIFGRDARTAKELGLRLEIFLESFKPNLQNICDAFIAALRVDPKLFERLRTIFRIKKEEQSSEFRLRCPDVNKENSELYKTLLNSVVDQNGNWSLFVPLVISISETGKEGREFLATYFKDDFPKAAPKLAKSMEVVQADDVLALHTLLRDGVSREAWLVEDLGMNDAPVGFPTYWATTPANMALQYKGYACLRLLIDNRARIMLTEEDDVRLISKRIGDLFEYFDNLVKEGQHEILRLLLAQREDTCSFIIWDYLKGLLATIEAEVKRCEVISGDMPLVRSLRDREKLDNLKQTKEVLTTILNHCHFLKRAFETQDTKGLEELLALMPQRTLIHQFRLQVANFLTPRLSPPFESPAAPKLRIVPPKFSEGSSLIPALAILKQILKKINKKTYNNLDSDSKCSFEDALLIFFAAIRHFEKPEALREVMRIDCIAECETMLWVDVIRFLDNEGVTFILSLDKSGAQKLNLKFPFYRVVDERQTSHLTPVQLFLRACNLVSDFINQRDRAILMFKHMLKLGASIGEMESKEENELDNIIRNCRDEELRLRLEAALRGARQAAKNWAAVALVNRFLSANQGNPLRESILPLVPQILGTTGYQANQLLLSFGGQQKSGQKGFYNSRYWGNADSRSSSATSAKSYASALADGNCAFNTAVLGICNLIVQDKIKSPGFYKDVGANLKVDSDVKVAVDTQEGLMAWLKDKDDTQRQKILAPVFRKLSIEFIERHYQYYQETYQQGLVTAFHGFRSGVLDETYCVHLFIKDRFIRLMSFFPVKGKGADVKEAKDQKDQDEVLKRNLIEWWEKEAKKLYFNTLKQPAMNAEEINRWGSEVEISALACHFGIMIRSQRGSSVQILGTGYGLLEGFSAEETAKLEALGLGVPYLGKIRLEVNKATLDYAVAQQRLTGDEIKSLTEAQRSKIINFLNNGDAKVESDRASDASDIKAIKELAHKLMALGAITVQKDGKTHQFAHERTVVHIVTPFSAGLKAKLSVVPAGDPPCFEIVHRGHHWDLVRGDVVVPGESKPKMQ